MVYKPRQVDAIHSFIEDRLKGSFDYLTNYIEGSFNYEWIRSFSQRFRESEISLLAAQLSGWIDYSGGPLDQTDLEALGIEDTVTPEEINEYMNDEDLDNLVDIVGVERSPGEPAIGTVTFTTVSAPTTIAAGTSVGTEPDSLGNYNEYQTNEEVSTISGETEVSVGVTAVEPGSEYNVGSGSVTYLPNPPTGVEGVVNNNSIEGGLDEETNDELRSRAKEAIFTRSGGGTAAGVRGYVLTETEDVTSVAIEEYPSGNSSTTEEYEGPGGPGDSTSTSPFADVIVEGGEDTAVEESISESRPVAIQHNLVRPKYIDINISAGITGSDLSASNVENVLETHIGELGLGEELVRDKLIQKIMNSDNDIEGIDYLTVSIDSEIHLYDSDNSSGDAPNHPLYKLRKGDSMTSDGITGVTGQLSGSIHEFVEGTDYDEGVVDGSDDDAIDWGIGGDDPDEDTEFEVTYNIADDLPVDSYEKTRPNSITVSEV